MEGKRDEKMQKIIICDVDCSNYGYIDAGEFEQCKSKGKN